MNVGRRIIELREKQGLTTNKLAGLAGIAQSALRSIELGEKSPTMDTLMLILKALEVSVTDFFTSCTINSTNDFREEIEIARKIKKLPEDHRKIVDTIIEMNKDE
jgi:transcriptional regulator with XRE-family HTH domain